MKKKILVAASVIVLSIGLLSVSSNLLTISKQPLSGFEKNQMHTREEYYKREIPKLYFRKVGYFYLTKGRYYVNRFDIVLARVFDVGNHALLVAGMFLLVVLL